MGAESKQSGSREKPLASRILNIRFILGEKFNASKIRTVSYGSYLDNYLSKMTNMDWRLPC